LVIFPGIRIRQNTLASIKSFGLMGEKYLELTPGDSESPYLKTGDFVRVKEDYIDYDQLPQKVSELINDLREIIKPLRESIASKEAQTAIKDTLLNLQTITAGLNDLLEQNSQNVQSMIDNLKQFSINLNNLLAENKTSLSEFINDLRKVVEIMRQKLPALADQFQATAKELEDLLVENQDSLQQGIKKANQLILDLKDTTDHLNKILTSIDEGKGTIGKLIRDESIYNEFQETLSGVKKAISKAESLRLYLGFRSEYFTRFEQAKSYFSLRLQPSEDKYYLFELIDDFRGVTSTKETEVFVDGNGPFITREQVIEDDFTFSLQIAKRLKNIAFRGGLIEAKGGAGLDLFLMEDKLKLHFDIWDLTATKPHLRVFGDYSLGEFFSFVRDKFFLGNEFYIY